MIHFFMTVQWLGLLILLFEIIYLLYQRPSKYQVTMLVMELCNLLIVVGYLLELQAKSLDVALVGVKIGYLGKPFALFSVLVFSCQYSRIKVPKVVYPLLGILNAAIVTIVFTNDYHHLYYATLEFVNDGYFPHLEFEKGPFYYIYIIIIAIYSVLVCAIAIYEYSKATNKSMRKRALMIWAIVGSSILGLIPYLCGITGGYDTTVPGCVLASIFVLILLIKYRVYDSLTYAKDTALNKINKGVIIVDDSNNLLYNNDFIVKMYPEFNTENSKEIINFLLNQHEMFTLNDRKYVVFVTNIEKNNVNYGNTIEIVDVTEEEDYHDRLIKEVNEKTRNLRDVQNKIVASFANMVEARDDSTGTHIKNTSTYVELLANKAKFNPKFTSTLTNKYINVLVNVAPLHDLGKISISDTILCKPGKLTKEEFDVIKTHTTIGAKLIEDNLKDVETDEYVKMAKDVALFHHEKWNGLGYPTGIKGNDIPLSARIMAIADVFDALISKRCYKPQMTVDDAFTIIKEGRGEHFDPDLVDAFLDCKDEILKRTEK